MRRFTVVPVYELQMPHAFAFRPINSPSFFAVCQQTEAFVYRKNEEKLTFVMAGNGQDDISFAQLHIKDPHTR